jgi:hypothetical protein
MLTEDMLRRIQGADYYHDEEETHWPLWRLYYGWPAIALVIGIAAYAVWRLFHG